MKKQQNNIPSTQTIYQYHAKQEDGFRFLFTPNPDFGQGWTRDCIAFEVPLKTDPNSICIYKYGHDQSTTLGGWRFYYAKQNQGGKGWIMQNVQFYAYNEPINGSVPIYRFKCQQKDGFRFHYHITDEPTKQGWTMDCIAFYGYPSKK